MEFFRQIKSEIKNIFSSKFILVFAILVGLGSIAPPVITALTPDQEYSGPIMYSSVDYAAKEYYEGGYYGDGQDPIQVGDVMITSENPFYWNLSDILYQKEYLQTYTGYSDEGTMLTTPKAVDLALELLDAEFEYFGLFAVNAPKYDDYRYQLNWDGLNALHDQFVYLRVDTEDHDTLREAANYRMYMDSAEFEKKYYKISPTDRLAALDAAETKLDLLYDIVGNNNFAAYIDLMISQQNDQIASKEAEIEMYEGMIVENPDQEEALSANIKRCQDEIDMINNSTIPWLEFRRANNIIPGSGMWQDSALNDIVNNESNLQYMYVMTEEEFAQDIWTAQQYGSYSSYLAAMEKQKDGYREKILIAGNCLNSNQPDMRYVPKGARFITVSFLVYSIAVALFAVLLGGWLIASEFQSGTIRLLMIRPRTRTKILMAKFLAALSICLALYLACTLVNILINGILFGFGDFAYPNMTVSGEVGFFASYVLQFLACCVTIIFAFSVAFMMSVLVKNIAVSIIVPVICYVGGTILLAMVAYTSAAHWIAWTPIPFLQIYNFFIPTPVSTNFYYSLNPIQIMQQNGVPLSLAYGIIMLLALAGVCVFVSVMSFRKRDITQ
jgi:ABC-2 type transport system permease protein